MSSFEVKGNCANCSDLKESTFNGLRALAADGYEGKVPTNGKLINSGDVASTIRSHHSEPFSRH